METRKIAVACFIGGAIGTAVALVVAWWLWWLGMVVGFCAGYLTYEFKEVLKAIADTGREMAPKVASAWNKMWDEIRTWPEKIRIFFSEPHPLIYPATAAVLPLWMGLVYAQIVFLTWPPEEPTGITMIALVILNVVVSFVLWMLAMIILSLVAAIGADADLKRFCFPYANNPERWLNDCILSKRRYWGNQHIHPTYGTVLRYFAIGCGVLLGEAICGLAKGIVQGFRACLVFLWKVFKRIHSEKRLLCGIDSAIGCAIAYVCFVQASMTSAEALLAVLAGGVFGATFGVLNYEIVSKRLLHLVHQKI